MKFERGFRCKLGDFIDTAKEFSVIINTVGNGVYDTCCFGIDSEEKMSDDRYTVFYNQPESPNKEIIYVKEKEIDSYKIRLDKLPPEVCKLVFTVSIDNDGRMGDILEHKVELVQDGNPVLEMILEGSHFCDEKAVIDVEIYRKGEWRMAAVARGFDGGLDALVKNYGGQIAEENNDTEQVENNDLSISDEEEIKKIIDDIEPELTDDPVTDYNYLKDEAKKYQNHKYSKEILTLIGKMMFKDIPTMARKNLKADLTGDADSFNAMIKEAETLIQYGQWEPAGAILANLIGDGIGVQDTADTEYYNYEGDIQRILYSKLISKGKKNLVELPVRFDLLYGLYGGILMELRKPDRAEIILAQSVRYNPLNSGFVFEYMETFKVRNDLGKFEKLNRDYYDIAYRASDIGRIYRNLGFVYIEKKDYETAVVLYKYSQVYEPENRMAEHELEYISRLTGIPAEEHIHEEPAEVLKRNGIPSGISPGIILIVRNNAYIESHINHDLVKTEYFCRILFDITRDEKLVNSFMDYAKRAPQNADKEETQPMNSYDLEKLRSLKEAFPDYPEISECKFKITFTVSSVKYKDAIYQILTHIDDISQLTDGKDVTVFFSDIKATAKHAKYINDIVTLAYSWKSFSMTINEVKRNKYDLKYFFEYLVDNYGVNKRDVWKREPEFVLKEYRKEIAPKRIKKEYAEDNLEINIAGCSPAEIVTGIANAYVTVYLSEYDVKVIKDSDFEIILSADDDLVVDIWTAPYGFEPYGDYTFFIQELTYNKLFKYNVSAFKRIFKGKYIDIQHLLFDGPNRYQSSINRLNYINEKYPELRIKEKYDEYPGDPYTFVIVEMENADGSTGYGVGFTNKKPKDLLLKVCKELEKKTNANLEGNGANGLEFDLSKGFINAFLSWKGEKKTQRLENHLRYYYIEKMIKNSYEAKMSAKEFVNEAISGTDKDVERKTYTDIGRR